MSVFTVEDNTLPRPNYVYITDVDEAKKHLSDIVNYPVVEADTETTGLDPYTSKVSLLQLGVPGKSYVFDVRHDTEHSNINLEIFKGFFENPNIIKIFQNAVFDMKMLKCHGGYYPDNIYDTMLVEQLLNLGKTKRGASLSDLVKKYLGLIMNKEPRGTFQDYNQVFKPHQLEYAASDVEVLSLIRDLQLPAIVENKFENVCRLEFEFTRPMCEMELNGITLDVDKWRIMMKDIKHDAIEAANKVQSMLAGSYGQNVMFGMPVINLESNQQLLNALKKYGLTIESTDAKVLKKYQDVPVIKALLEYRKLAKLVSTYGESLLERINPVTGRLHTRFQQMVSTGRMSSSAPNLQNIPKKQKYRSCFISKPGYKLITADMSSAELRCLGNFSDDPVFLQCFNNNIDLHSRSASEVFQVPIEEVDHTMRTACKAISFGLCLDEGTEILTSDGIVSIDNTSNGALISHDVGNDSIIDNAYMGKKQVYELESKFGYTLRCTKDHLIKVIDAKGNYTDKKLEDINLDKDQVCIKLGSNIFNNNYYKFDPFNYPLNTNAKDFVIPKILCNEWASFFGLFISEGHLHKNKLGNYNSVQFGMSVNDVEFIAYIDNLFNNLFDNYSRSVNNGIVSYSANSAKFANWLSTVIPFDSTNKTATVDIPNCIKQSPKGIQISFIRTLFEGDGTVSSKGKSFDISYSSKSYFLLKSLQLMLLNFGILSKIRETNDKRYPINKYYKLDVVDTKCKIRFANVIGFITDRKNSKCICTTGFKRSVFRLNYPAAKLKLLKDKVSKDRCVNKSNINNSNRYLYNQLNYYGREYINNAYFEVLSNYDSNIKFIYDNNIITLPINSIKKIGYSKVYDISVKNHQYFLANGFVVHNCYGMSKYGLADRLNISEKESERLINNYFNVFSAIKSHLDKSARDGVKLGYSISVSGRRRFYNIPPFGHPDRKKIQRAVERQAKNMPVQSSNADTIKESMIYLVDRLEESGYDAKLILTVHDEVVVEVREDQIEQVAPIVQGCLKDGFGRYFHKISMESDALVGPCWLKDSCEEKDENGDTCDCCTMTFVPDDKLGTKLACSKCGALQE